MKVNIVGGYVRTVTLFASLTSLCESSVDSAQTGGMPALAERIVALEALVTSQSNQIAILTGALEAEVHARIGGQLATLDGATNYTNERITGEARARVEADALLQAQINDIQPSPFSTPQASTLRRFADVVNMAETDILVSANLCVVGNIAIEDSHTLLANHIQPNGGACTGNLAGLTLFTGNVGITPTNSIFVNSLRPISLMPPTPADCPHTGTMTGCGVFAPGNYLLDGAILFRR